MSRSYWIVKQEPSDYSWDDFVRDGGTAWTGVRNFQARNHLRGMQSGDLVAFYHSGTAKCLVGLARVQRTAYADPTATEGDWSCVDLVPVTPLRQALALNEIKADPTLQKLALVRQSRLSVMPVEATAFRQLLRLTRTPLPR